MKRAATPCLPFPVIRGALFLLLAGVAAAQSIEITPAAVDRGEANIFRLILKGRPDQGIVALQCDLAIPPELHVDLSDVVAGSAAESADKTMTCALRTKGPTIGCILAGGSKTIPDGTVIIVKFSAVRNPGRRVVPVEMKNALGVSSDLKKIPFADAAANVTIR